MEMEPIFSVVCYVLVGVFWVVVWFPVSSKIAGIPYIIAANATMNSGCFRSLPFPKCFGFILLIIQYIYSLKKQKTLFFASFFSEVGHSLFIVVKTKNRKRLNPNIWHQNLNVSFRRMISNSEIKLKLDSRNKKFQTNYKKTLASQI